MPDRKEFLKQLGILGAGLCLGGMSIGLEGCKGTYYAPFQYASKKVTVSKADMALAPKGFAVIEDDRLPGSIYLHQSKEDKYTALLMICTHKRCTVNPAGKFLVCPCHGSEFDQSGKVIKSPAEKDLFVFNTSSDQDNIYIHLT